MKACTLFAAAFAGSGMVLEISCICSSDATDATCAPMMSELETLYNGSSRGGKDLRLAQWGSRCRPMMATLASAPLWKNVHRV